MRQRHGGNRCVQNFHERGEHDRGRNEIRVAVGAPALQGVLIGIAISQETSPPRQIKRAEGRGQRQQLITSFPVATK
jgi:hypothetical protein